MGRTVGEKGIQLLYYCFRKKSHTISVPCKGFEDLYLSTYSTFIPTPYCEYISIVLCWEESSHDLESLSLHPHCCSDLEAAWLVLG